MKEYYFTLNPANMIVLSFCLFLKTKHILPFSKKAKKKKAKYQARRISI